LTDIAESRQLGHWPARVVAPKGPRFGSGVVGSQIVPELSALGHFLTYRFTSL
jgi:hypothetical protein